MLKLKQQLPLGQAYLTFLSDPSVLEEAKNIAIHGSANGRCMEERVENAKKGLALQYSVAAFLQDEGYIVEIAPDGIFHYDLIVNGILVDVKGRWSGKFWSQSPWETAEIAKRKDRVLYMCIDVFPNKFVHEGQCWSEKLEESIFNSPYAKHRVEIL